ncbi:ATP-grasp domain-containing protein [Legionella pneumophila]|uniref:ATP-grasp domain-containing protein n=1 Tax=Legionella pneumophila TaxID=446 RepID=UPI000487EB6E|nr:ATP-grasp domain-containing protein [Legionella pneumophila]RYW91238.1 ATP-grasp domain-containing protein [Legionella pneumophila]STX97674.1 Glutathione synthase/Ribosomal protein S6 modification enzyme (glutaminyl transferase) [Legionella pneumophila]HAT1775273.1 ATP-grasp domain-containing protein [Legionella pneumophila]HAT1778786.1 ATP-grasp domain-containing protein [Legionella pneumophila]HAT2018836.1 ATP-grasp domain-containing protein [Legionella pneumophila]
MNRPVVIVDPLSSGIELAPAFKARGIPAIAVTLKPLDWVGFGANMQTSDFIEIIPDQPNLVEVLAKYDPIAIIPGTEEGVPLAEALVINLTPQFANDPEKSQNRFHKAMMQKALQEAGVPALKTLNTASENEVEAWIRTNGLIDSPLIIKPPVSAGSDKVFHIPARGEWKKAFNRVLSEPSKITGKVNATVVVQEQAIGTEFAVGTVSANGKHYLAHLIQYNKTSFNDRKTVYDYVEFVPYNKESYGELFDYTQKALDALGIRWGAAHNEIMLTKDGPRLIETGARMCGGPVVGFAREATGSSQADKLVEIYVDGGVSAEEYVFKKTVVPVFLKSPAKGKISNVEAFADLSKLPTFLNEHIWFKNGDLVPQTVDYLTSIGIIGLAGDRDSILLDYEKIRNMESKLVIQTF